MCAILVVEDHDETRQSLFLLLSHWGHTVSAAENIGSALRFVEQQAFDVILSDIELPDGTGYQFVAGMKERQLPGKIAAVTGLISETDVEAARQAGFDRHFAKPVDLERLKSWIDLMAAS